MNLFINNLYDTAWKGRGCHRKQKAREFMDLKQGDMSVGDYTAKFNELLQY